MVDPAQGPPIGREESDQELVPPTKHVQSEEAGTLGVSVAVGLAGMVLQGGIGPKEKRAIMSLQSGHQDERTLSDRTSSDSASDQVESPPDGSDH